MDRSYKNDEGCRQYVRFKVKLIMKSVIVILALLNEKMLLLEIWNLVYGKYIAESFVPVKLYISFVKSL